MAPGGSVTAAAGASVTVAVAAKMVVVVVGVVQTIGQVDCGCADRGRADCGRADCGRVRQRLHLRLQHPHFLSRQAPSKPTT